MEAINIISLGRGWYSFKNVPQGYIKVDGLMCETDRKAINQAKRLNPDFEYIIEKKGA